LAVSPVAADIGYPPLSTDIGPKRFKSAYQSSFLHAKLGTRRLRADRMGQWNLKSFGMMDFDLLAAARR
jgi:hypothetical protein